MESLRYYEIFVATFGYCHFLTLSDDFKCCGAGTFAHFAPVVRFVTRDFYNVDSAFFGDSVGDAIDFRFQPVHVEHCGNVPLISGCEVAGECAYCHRLSSFC